MQVTTPAYNALQAKDFRPLSWGLRISFDKQFNEDITFFTLDSSLLDGPDILAPTGDNVITEWDKYDYADYTDRVVSIEWSSDLDYFYSLTSSIADVTVNNYDNLFTKNSTSPLTDDLLPRRPIRLLAGFGNQLLPQFVGLTEFVPQVYKNDRTARLHAIDFLSYIFSRKLDRSVMYENLRVEQILRELFNLVGVLDSQMKFDRALTTVPYAYFTKNQTLGDASKDLLIAEMGSLYMDESGFLVFKSRLRQKLASVYTLDGSNIIDYDTEEESNIVNSVSVKADVRAVQPLQVVYNLEATVEPFLIGASQTVTKFFELDDPATSILTITSYTANSLADGTGTDLTANINIVNQELFSDTVLVEIENTGGTPAYITGLTINGTPVQVVSKIDVLEKDQTSIDQFEEQVYNIKSPYIQDTETAQALALMIINHFKNYGNTLSLRIKGNMALQLNDVVTINIDDISGDYVVTRKENTISRGGYYQRLQVQKYEIPDYFVLSSDTEDRSLLDGGDVLSP
jgi:hypothetical protein